MKSIVGILSFDPNTDAAASFVLVSDLVVAEVPEGYTPDKALTLTISADIAASTAGMETRIVAVEYEFV